MRRLLWTYFWAFVPAMIFGQNPDIDLLRARACMDQNKVDSALRILTSMQGTRNNFQKNLWIGDCFYRKASFTKANRYYMTADSLKKGGSSYELSCTYAQLNDVANAMDWLQKYLALPTKKSELEILKDSALGEISKTREWKTIWAKDWYSRSEIERNTINALIAKGKADEAMTELESNEGLFTPRHEYFYLQAKILEAQHLQAPAMASIEKAISLYDFSEDYLALYSNFLKSNKKYKEALEYITKAIRINPYNPVFYLKRGEIARLAGNYQLAANDLQMYRDLYPDFTETYHQLGLLEIARGNNQNAMDFYDILLTKDKAHSQYFLERGNLGLTLDQIQKADEDFSLALDLNPNLQEAYLKKGNTLHILNDPSGACFYWSKAKELGSSEAAKLIYQNCKE